MSTLSPASLTETDGLRSPSPAGSSASSSPSASMVSSASSPVLEVSGRELRETRLAMGSRLTKISARFNDMQERLRGVVRLIETQIRANDLKESCEETDALGDLARRIEALLSSGETVVRARAAAQSSLHYRTRSEESAYPTSMPGKLRRFVSQEIIDDEELGETQQNSAEMLQALERSFGRYQQGCRSLAEEIRNLKSSGTL